MKIDSLNLMGLNGTEFQRARKADEQKAASAQADMASIKTSYSRLLDQSLQRTTFEDAGAVEEARRALAAGELDRPEAIRETAEKILKRGI